VYISAEVLAAHGVAARLGSVALPPPPLPDLLVWSPTAEGELTAKQAYNFFLGSCHLEDLHSSISLIYFLASCPWKNAYERESSFLWLCYGLDFQSMFAI